MILRALRVLNEKAEEIICVALLTMLMGVVFAGVVMRFVFASGFAWQEELVGITYVWLNYFGVSLGAKRGAHIRILTFLTPLAAGTRKRILLTADLAWIVFNVAVFYISMDLLRRMMRHTTITPILSIDLAHAHYIIPICMVITTARIIEFNWRQRRLTEH